jgi:hypothetical protein
MRSLKLATYRPGIVRHFVAPYKVLRLPGVWLVSLWYAGLVGLIVILSLVGTQLVAAPPYLWGKNVGLINIGGLIGTFLGCVSNTTASVNLMLTKRSGLYLLRRRLDYQTSCEERHSWFLGARVSSCHCSSSTLRRYFWRFDLWFRGAKPIIYRLGRLTSRSCYGGLWSHAGSFCGFQLPHRVLW